jgi:hypothetical protein
VVVDCLVGDERIFRCLYLDVRPLECMAKIHPYALCDMVVIQQPVGVIDFSLEVVDIAAVERCREYLFIERFGKCPDAVFSPPSLSQRAASSSSMCMRSCSSCKRPTLHQRASTRSFVFAVIYSDIVVRL